MIAAACGKSGESNRNLPLYMRMGTIQERRALERQDMMGRQDSAQAVLGWPNCRGLHEREGYSHFTGAIPF